MKTTRMLTIVVLALGLTAEVVNADFTFGTPTNLGPTVNSSYDDYDPSISADGLSLFFNSYRPGGSGGGDTWVTTRKTTDDPWSSPMNLGPTVNSTSHDTGPNISSDGLSLYFSSNRPGGYGDRDLWVTTRETKEDAWGTPVNLGPGVNSSYSDHGPSISADGLMLYFSEHPFGPFRPGGFGNGDIWVTTRPTTTDTWGEPVNLGPTVNSLVGEINPEISADGLLLCFDSRRPGGSGNEDIWVTRRATTNDPWEKPVNLGPTVNSSFVEGAPKISADGLSLFFHSSRPGGYGGRDLWQAPIEPVFDLNGDGIVDSDDMCIMVDHLGENYPLCDIGPMPWGDGIVDDQDQKVLSEYLLTYPGTLAYWKLDEAEGDIAYDSAGENDAIVFGEPLWQPEGGMVGGALEFDGIDDYVSTSSFMWSANGSSFSVFVWIKGGLPGQVIISQTDYADWLGADMTNGSLMTDLQFLGKSSRPLQSQTVITDGNWHRIGLVWDGSHRTLYVDDVEVAADKYDKGMLYGGLYIGAGKSLEPGTFWSGLIDDVHIYDRLITP